MALTLLQAKEQLATYVDVGMCASDIRVTPAINQAIQYLYSNGDFIGLIARYAVTPDANGEFDLPVGLSSISRVSEALSDQVGSNTGVFIANNAYAFVMDNPTVLPTRQLSPTRWKVLGRCPTTIDVMGKIQLNYIELNQDSLPVDDVYILRLVIRGQFCVVNNQGEMGVGLLQQALALMGSKTEVAVNQARKIAFTNIQNSSSWGTMGYMRAYFSLNLTAGMREDDAKCIELVNAAQELLISQSMPWVSGYFRVVNREFRTPSWMKTILKVDVNGCPTTVQSQWFDYGSNGYGWNDTSYGRGGYSSNGYNGFGIGPENVIYRGPTALHTDLEQASQISVYAYGDDNNADINIAGMDESGTEVRETVSASKGTFNISQTTFKSITSITKPPTAGPVSISHTGISGQTVEIAYLQPIDLSSELSKYWIGQPHGNGYSGEVCCPSTLRVIGVPAFRKTYRDNDTVFVKNLQANIQMAMYVLALRSGDKETIGQASYLKNSALQIMEQERVNALAGHQTQVEILGMGWGTAPSLGR